MTDNIAKKPVAKAQDSSLKDDFDNLTNGIQRILDLGAASLAEAEEKTAKVAKMAADSAEYTKIVKEVKAAQARAGEAFKQAEELITSANDLLPNKK